MRSRTRLLILLSSTIKTWRRRGNKRDTSVKGDGGGEGSKVEVDVEMDEDEGEGEEAEEDGLEERVREGEWFVGLGGMGREA